MQLISRSNFQNYSNTPQTDLFTLKNSKGMTAQITNYGASLVSLWVKDKYGEYRDVVLGYEKLEDYLKLTNPYFGRTIGRYGNRISNAQFNISGQDYFLEKNDGRHNLHSGNDAYHTVVWEVTNHTVDSLEFSHLSVAGKGGFPGSLNTKISYKITEENMLDIRYEATTDADTHVNLTHHSYFNLESSGQDTVQNHVLQIQAETYLPVSEECIPLAQSTLVTGTPFNFLIPTHIGLRINSLHPQIQGVQGYDHNYVLEGRGYREVAKVYSPNSGIKMKVLTDEPGLQFYTGNNIESHPIGKYNISYKKRSGFCLETQHYPDSPNRPDFPSTLLKKEDTYTSRCTYAFSTNN